MQTTSQVSPPSAACPPLLAVGYDGGNGSVKLIVDNAETRIPAYIQPLHSEIYDVPESSEGSLIEYLGGDRADLVGKRWLAGYSAYERNPQSGSPKQVRMHCSGEQSTKLHQCDSPTSWKRITSS